MTIYFPKFKFTLKHKQSGMIFKIDNTTEFISYEDEKFEVLTETYQPNLL